MDEAQKHLERAVQLHSAGAWADAIDAYEAALALAPDLLEAAIGLARVRELRGQWSFAADGWSRVLAIDPEHAEAATYRAECLRQAACYHLALPAYDTALVLDGEQLYALAGKAETLRMLGRPDEALHWFDRALSVHAEHTFALRGKAAALNALARFDEAIPYWEHAAALDPTSTFAAQGLKEARFAAARLGDGAAKWAARHKQTTAAPVLVGDQLVAEIDLDWGRALVNDERWAEAASALERSLDKRPGRTDVLRELARVYEADTRWDDAYRTWSRVHELQPDRIDAVAAQGDALRRAGHLAEALDAYDRALAAESPEPSAPGGAYVIAALAGRGETLRRLGRAEDAVQWFDLALDRKPTHAVSLRGKASALNDLGRYDEARPVWRQALAIDPASEDAQTGLQRCEEAMRLAGDELSDPPTVELDPAARDRARQAYDKGRALMQQGRYPDAATALRLATDEDPSWTSAWYLLGLCQEEDRQYRLAVRTFSEVLARDADHLDAACHRADAMRRSNDYQGAIASYDAILELHADEVRATAGRAEALRMLGRFEEAVEWFDRTLALRPRQYLALCGKAAALNALRRYDEALPLWLAALRENPNASFVKRGLAQCRAGVGDRGDARARRSMLRRSRPIGRADDTPLINERAIVQVPHGYTPSLTGQGSEGALVTAPPTTLSVPRARIDRDMARDELDRGRLFYKDRNYAAAVACFESALRYDPTFAEAALRLGMAHEDDRQYRRAIEAYERCLAIEPNHYQAATNIGEALRKNERYEEAIKAYDRALAMRSDYLYALAGRAECMRMLNDYQGCLVWFERALQVGPRHAFAVQGKAAALNTLHRYKEALPLWEKALEIEPQSPFARDGKATCEHLAEEVEEESTTRPRPCSTSRARPVRAGPRRAFMPVIGREGEIHSVMKTLVRRLKANPLLLGDPGVGKTAVVEGVAQALARVGARAAAPPADHRAVDGSPLAGAPSTAAPSRSASRDIIKEARENLGSCRSFIRSRSVLVGAGVPRAARSTPRMILKPVLEKVAAARSPSSARPRWPSTASTSRPTPRSIAGSSPFRSRSRPTPRPRRCCATSRTCTRSTTT
ncbi:MAG: tetratricopeptide repeat protein [Myxococcota bacterium]